MLRIGEVASAAGVSVRSLRYYEEQGLVVASRTPTGQRRYAADVVDRVRLIQQFFAAGLPSRVVSQILPSIDAGISTPAAIELLSSELDRLTALIVELQTTAHRLDGIIGHARRHSAGDDAVCAPAPGAPSDLAS